MIPMPICFKFNFPKNTEHFLFNEEIVDLTLSDCWKREAILPITIVGQIDTTKPLKWIFWSGRWMIENAFPNHWANSIHKQITIYIDPPIQYNNYFS